MLTFADISQMAARGTRFTNRLRSVKRHLDGLSRIDWSDCSREERARAEQARADALAVIAKGEAILAGCAAQRRQLQEMLATNRQLLQALSGTDWPADRRADAVRMTAELADHKAKCEAMLAAIDSFGSVADHHDLSSPDARHDLNHPRWQGPLQALSHYPAE